MPLLARLPSDFTTHLELCLLIDGRHSRFWMRRGRFGLVRQVAQQSNSFAAHGRHEPKFFKSCGDDTLLLTASI